MTIRQGNNIIAGRSSQCGFEIGDIGMSIFVDESKGIRRYLNGSTIDINRHSQGFLNRLKQVATLYPSISCTESEWQTIKTMSVHGQCGKFVIDEVNGTIRLPRIVMPIQGLTDLSKLGEIVEQGLPNHTHNENFVFSEGVRPLSAQYNASATTGNVKSLAQSLQHNSNDSYPILQTDGASSSTYKDGSNVQQEQIQYPYFIQIATGQETSFNIENEVEFNNPYSLGDSKYSPQELNNTSWLASKGQWNDGSIYKSFFEYYLDKIGEPFGLGTVKNATQSYSDYDLVIDNTNWQFRLPLLDGSEDLVSDRYDDLTLQSSGSTYTAPANGWVDIRTSIEVSGYLLITTSLQKVHQTDASSQGSIIFPVRKGQTYQVHYQNIDQSVSYAHFRFIYAKGNGTLYYYVGETVQNANLIDAGRIAEQLTNKVDLDFNNANYIPANINASNLNTTGKDTISSLSMPSNRYINLSFTHSAQYIAPANGWYTIRGWISSPTLNSVMGFVNNTSSLYMTNQLAGAENSQRGISIPAKKGDVVTALGWNATITMFRFIYAEGSN